jgi:hypothetical protein
MSASDKSKISNEQIERVLFDVIRGYSVLRASSSNVYFRHLNSLQVLEIEDIYNQYFESAQRSGLKSEKELLDMCIRNGTWSVKNNEEITALLWTIDKKEKAKDKSSDFLQKKSLEQSIENDKNALNTLRQRRAKLAQFSAEKFAEQKKIQGLIDLCLFMDPAFSEPLHPNVEIDVINLFFEKMSFFNEKNLMVYVSFHPLFFDLFCVNQRNPHVIFDKPAFALTVYQKNILLFANSILSKLKSLPIPEEICDDPVKILNFKERSEAKQSKTSHGLSDLKAKSVAKGGKLTAEDFLS